VAPRADAAPVVVALEGAAKTYAGGTAALLPVDLQVRAGEFVSLLGPSGCGKSTLLKLVAGLLQPSAGRVQCMPDAGDGAAGRSLGYVFQEPTLLPWARVLANVRLPLDLAGVARPQAETRARDALAQVGLVGFEQALPRQLSGGMQMRVSIARALVTRPRLLLMDEPFGALDEITRSRLDSELLAIWHGPGDAPQRGALTVLFVTHSIHEAVFLSTRVLVMAARPGRIVQAFDIDEPYPRHDAFRVSTRFAEHAQRLQVSLQAASAAAA
jgi:NitT/TauT family transport system ATP-binding protein